jgi:hypothetical protein
MVKYNLPLLHINKQSKIIKMKTVTVNIAKQTVTVDGETCNFYEAGLIPNGVVTVDADEIEEHLLEREGEDAEITFEGNDINNPAAFQALVSINDNTKVRVYNDEAGLEFVIMIDGNDRTETSNFAVCDYVSKRDGLVPATIEDYLDEEHELMTDENGDEYVEWVNGDFNTPFDVDSVSEKAKNYL